MLYPPSVAIIWVIQYTYEVSIYCYVCGNILFSTLLRIVISLSPPFTYVSISLTQRYLTRVIFKSFAMKLYIINLINLTILLITWLQYYTHILRSLLAYPSPLPTQLQHFSCFTTPLSSPIVVHSVFITYAVMPGKGELLQEHLTCGKINSPFLEFAPWIWILKKYSDVYECTSSKSLNFSWRNEIKG